MKYIPERWVILKISNDTDLVYKVFGGWLGGYTTGDSWKLSSGILEIKEHEDHYEMPQESGSLYICYKNSVGMTSYMQQILNHWTTQNTDRPYQVGTKIEIISEPMKFMGIK